MPTTPTGRIRYNPRAETVKYRPGWAVLSVGAGWFHLYDHWLQRGIPGQWRHVSDEDRVFTTDYLLDEQSRRRTDSGTWGNRRINHGGFVDSAPRLGLVRQKLQPPAWGPHISLVRGTRLRQNQDDWTRFWKGRNIEFEFDPVPVTNGHHWWLWVDCPAMEEFRVHFGLQRQHPGIRPHLTFAVISGEGGAIRAPAEYCL